MAKFRFYITDLHEGRVKGSNDIQVALDYCHSEDYYAVDAETGEMFCEDGSRTKVEEVGA